MSKKGYKMSEEHKRKISEANKKSHLGLSWGRHTDAHKKKMSKVLTGIKRGPLSEERRKHLKNLYSGDKCRFWRGGITSLISSIRHCYKYRQWISDVFTRDDFTCQHCNKRGGKLNADHIIPFVVIMEKYKIKTLDIALECDELWNINNGRTLCIDCHKRTDTYGARAKKLIKRKI